MQFSKHYFTFGYEDLPDLKKIFTFNLFLGALLIRAEEKHLSEEVVWRCPIEKEFLKAW